MITKVLSIFSDDLKTIFRYYEFFGLARNKIIETLKKLELFDMGFCYGSNFDFKYGGIEHSIMLDVYRNKYILDFNTNKPKKFKNLSNLLEYIREAYKWLAHIVITSV